jgi:hypothetical protein
VRIEMSRDYWVSAMIRRLPDEFQQSKPLYGGIVLYRRYRLWTQRIQAATLVEARKIAYALVAEMQCEVGELQILWDDARPYIAGTMQAAS